MSLLRNIGQSETIGEGIEAVQCELILFISVGVATLIVNALIFQYVRRIMVTMDQRVVSFFFLQKEK